ncbi:MAG TPA: HD domain-containing protein [Burkholderiales bacterium]|nr:HD domain-containing protein [Burkholderiales bacterium]
MAAQVASSDLILRAVAFAAHKHRDQRRKDKDASPYINHPIQLAKVLWEEGGVRDAEVIAAALLHDTLEDTETTLQELRGEFGEDIAEIVLEVSDIQWIRKQVRKRLQVARARYSSEQARLVKLADKICNLRDMSAHPPAGWPLERKQQYFDWAKEVVDRLRGTHAVLEQKFDEVYALKP